MLSSSNHITLSAILMFCAPPYFFALIGFDYS